MNAVPLPPCLNSGSSIEASAALDAAMSTPGTKRKGNALKESYALDSSEVKAPRKRGCSGIQGVIDKTVADHCKGWTAHQLNVREVEGPRARE
eukprot:2929408-Amphidinium_carterae.1